MKTKPFVLLAGGGICLLGVLWTSCRGLRAGRGFHLPGGGIAKGREAFVQLGCNQCHSVKGVELAKPKVTSPVQVVLGGDVLRVKTYGQLVTSIINPEHVVSRRYREKLGDSARMADFRNTMTVTQMIDIVAFLHSTYTKISPEYLDYSFPYGLSGTPAIFPGSPTKP
jgi:L-cysteine S-thiosulfotransferase